MSALSTPGFVPIQDYLDGELASDKKHEYLGGFVHAMAGGTNRHSDVVLNAGAALLSRLRGKPCRPSSSETKVRIQSPTQTRFYYPDVMVTCDRNAADLTFQDHPVVLIEVLSPSTRRIDAGEKRDWYMTIPSLRVYLMVEPDFPHVLIDRRNDDGFGFSRELHEDLDGVIPLPEIDAELPLRELYED